MAGRSTSQQAQSKRRKRPQPPPVYGGLGSSYEDRDTDFVCPICFDTIDEAYMTKCGHSFCYKCICQSLEQSNRCPKCSFVIEKSDQIFPNFLLNELILKHKQKVAEQKRIKLEHLNGCVGLQQFHIDQDHLDLSNINYLLDVLAQRKARLIGECKAVQYQILKEFLGQVRQHKQEKLDEINRELNLISSDLSSVEAKLSDHRSKHPYSDLSLVNGFDLALASTSSSGAEVSTQDGFNSSKNSGKVWPCSSMASQRKKVHQHFDDLQAFYFTTRQRDLLTMPSTPSASASSSCSSPPCDTTITPLTCDNSSTSEMNGGGSVGGSSGGGGGMKSVTSTEASGSLNEFCESLSKFTKYSSCRPLATLNYANDLYNTSSIVSSVEFDRDCDYFAIAGVTKKIKVFEYSTVIRDALDVHYPTHEMVCNSKISSIIWSSYHKGMLASSDYEGTVTLWDVFTGVKSKVFQEHEKRCWSVDFNRMDSKLLASGSDDSKVKLWYTNMENSVASIEAKANVCCVKFNPESRYHLTFGSADHCVHYYDLRSTKQPLQIFKGHRKAVSYAKFVSGTELVSASTDSQLKLWNLSEPHCLRTFRGHTNEKNFVGLATDGDYVACGSENNSLYIYYKGLSKQLLTFKFDTVRSVLEKDKKEDDANEFVSAVCWRPGSNVVLAANSQGTIKVLELI